MGKDLLLSPEEFLKSGIHIGTRFKTKGMKKYIYSSRKDGLKVLALATIRIDNCCKNNRNIEPSKVAIVGRRVFAKTAIELFCKVTDTKPVIGRFIPGTFTNTDSKTFMEPELIVVTESNLDKQAIAEAKDLDLPVIGFCSTNNFTENIDLIVPANNKGKKSVATLFWLLAREVQLEKGIIKTRQEFTSNVDDFEFKGKEKRSPSAQTKRGPRRFFRRGPPSQQRQME
jgi:small subunit ribosomal protein S2